MVDDNIRMLAQKVWESQKDPIVQQKWVDYCSIFGNDERDPLKHNESFLSGFVQVAANHVSQEQMYDYPCDNDNFSDISQSIGVVNTQEGGVVIPQTGGNVPDSCQIFVGGLPHQITEEMILQYFSQFGEVVRIHLKQGKGFCFVHFAAESAVDAIIGCGMGHQINGKTIDCKRKQFNVGGFGPQRTQQRQILGPYVTQPVPQNQVQSKGSILDGPVESTEIFVGALPQNIDEQTIAEYFSQYGIVSRIHLKEGKGFAFVTFTRTEPVDTILQINDQHFINGKKIDCKPRVRDVNRNGGLPVNQGAKAHEPSWTMFSMQSTPQIANQSFRTLNSVIPAVPVGNQLSAQEIIKRKIFVGGLPHGCREEHLRESFGAFGNITQIDCKNEKGFAFIHFEEIEAVQTILAQQGVIVGGQLVDCKPADRPTKYAQSEGISLLGTQQPEMEQQQMQEPQVKEEPQDEEQQEQQE